MSSKRSGRRYTGAKDSDDEGEGLDPNCDKFINPQDAIKLVRSPDLDTIAPTVVEKIVWQRILG
jgi:hypothetical protein